MTKATKLTPSLAWALVVFNNVRVEESYPLDGLLLYEGARAFIFKRRFTNRHKANEINNNINNLKN